MTMSISVVYGWGSMAPRDLYLAAKRNDVRVSVVVPETEHGTVMLPVLADLFPTYVAKSPSDVLAVAPHLRGSSAMVTFSEELIAWTARAAAVLGIRHTAEQDIPSIVDKTAQRERLALAGVPCPAFVRVTDAEELARVPDRLGFPFVVKPAVGGGSRGTFRVGNVAELKAVTLDLLHPDVSSVGEGFIAESELIGRPTPSPWGDYVAVDVASIGGTTTTLTMLGKLRLDPPFRERGAFAPWTLDEHDAEEAVTVAHDAVRALSIENGIGCVEMKLTVDGPRVIEVNGRLGAWGDWCMASAFGNSALDAFFAALKGQEQSRGVSRKVAYAYVVNPPLGRTRLKSVDRESLRELPGVASLKMTARPGEELDSRLGSRAAVAAIYGEAMNHKTFAELVQVIEVGELITYDGSMKVK
ncbi:D-Ala-D-Ala ligase-like protein [Curtobacterium sp. PhB142]|nr:D-Ala-D-Ala ligase-like protein [Curtobacterium sp. PhB142]TCM04188.1 D-Ala-D-Ala ligase-like protein [Curtobacterium sp. PhB134]